MNPRIPTSALLQELQNLHKTQQVRISRNGEEALITTSPDVVADLVPHAVGKRKPSLEELDQMYSRRFNRSRSRR